MPRAIICGVMITIIVYVCVNFSFLCVLNVEEMKSSSLITYSFAFKLAGKTDKNLKFVKILSNSGNIRKISFHTTFSSGVFVSFWFVSRPGSDGW